VPVHLHVVISDNSTRNIWTELCTKYYTRIKTVLHASDKDRVQILFFKNGVNYKKWKVLHNTGFPVAQNFW